MFKYDLSIIGGCGRVGLPLAIAFADKKLNVGIYDTDENKTEMVRNGRMPFIEEGCEAILQRVINKNLVISNSPDIIAQSKYVIVVIGTPVEEHLNPQYLAMLKFFQGFLPYFVAGQCIILRSTVYPGTAERINDYFKEQGLKVKLAFCPERIVEGKALFELQNLPQIVSAFDPQTVKSVSNLFSTLTKDIVVVKPIEAELAKLYSNTWRYVQFAAANQFYILADQYDINYRDIYRAMTYNYPRMQGLPGPGFAAGPCLFKDTMQLIAFSNNNFFLGHVAMLINEGLPNYIVQKLKREMDLKKKNVGILGMAFKANSDDPRDSLSFKLKKVLEIESKKVYCSDPYIERDYFVGADELVKHCDVIIIAAPHEVYRTLKLGKNKTLVDIWDFLGKGGKN